MRTCEACDVEKAESHFRKFGRGLKKVCRACEGRADGQKVLTSREEPVPVKLNGHLEVASGFGFRASIEDAQLRIEQDRSDGQQVYTHELWLARHEARHLIDWIVAQVGTQA